jgi:hypothetical protein
VLKSTLSSEKCSELSLVHREVQMINCFEAKLMNNDTQWPNSAH